MQLKGTQKRNVPETNHTNTKMTYNKVNRNSNMIVYSSDGFEKVVVTGTLCRIPCFLYLRMRLL